MTKMTAPCPKCSRESQHAFRTKDYNQRVTGESFDYYRCPSCGIVFLAPVPPDLEKYYPSEYHSPPSTPDEMEMLARREKYKIDLVKEFVSAGNLLEIGPSWGAFCLNAKNAGFTVNAIEMDSACCRFLSDVVGVNALHGSEILPLLDQVDPCDVAVLWHVVEHLPDPWRVLQAVSDKLNPGGILIIAAPNPDSLQFKAQGKRWPHVDAPRHVMLIPYGALSRNLEQYGMKTVRITTRDPGAHEFNLFGWRFLFANLSGNTGAYAWKALYAFGTLVGKLLSPFEKSKDRGSTYTAVFQKETGK